MRRQATTLPNLAVGLQSAAHPPRALTTAAGTGRFQLRFSHGADADTFIESLSSILPIRPATTGPTPGTSQPVTTRRIAPLPTRPRPLPPRVPSYPPSSQRRFDALSSEGSPTPYRRPEAPRQLVPFEREATLSLDAAPSLSLTDDALEAMLESILAEADFVELCERIGAIAVRSL